MEHKPLSVHFEELRQLLLRMLGILLLAAGGASFFLPTLTQFLLSPYGAGSLPSFLLLSPLEGWEVGLSIALLGGLLAASPLLLLLLFTYLWPALYQGERWGLSLMGAGILLFSGLGFLVGHYLFTPFLLKTLELTAPLQGTPSYQLKEALHFVVASDGAMILLFNLVGGLFFSLYRGWVGAQLLISWRRPFILLAFIVGALLTPPDVLSQLLMAGGLILGYELAILLGKAISA